LLTVLPPQRTIGVVLMLVGAFVAGFAYLAPVVWVDDIPVGAVTSRTGDAGRGDGVLVCVRCRERAADEQGRRDPTLSVDDWATGLLDASVCHLCPDTGLETAATTASCPCCGSSFRQPPGGDGRTWIISPGPGTARAEPAAR
jgi:hypothetical protein